MYIVASQSAATSIFWFGIGFLISMIGVNPLFTLLFYDLPMSISCLKRNYFHSKAPVISYCVSLLVVTLIVGYGWKVAAKFSHGHFPAFLWGLGLAAIPGTVSLLRVQENLSDFLRDNQDYLTPSGENALSHQVLPNHPSLRRPPIETTKTRSGLFKFLKRFTIKLRIGRFQILIQ